MRVEKKEDARHLLWGRVAPKAEVSLYISKDGVSVSQ